MQRAVTALRLGLQHRPDTALHCGPLLSQQQLEHPNSNSTPQRLLTVLPASWKLHMEIHQELKRTLFFSCTLSKLYFACSALWLGNLRWMCDQSIPNRKDTTSSLCTPRGTFIFYFYFIFSFLFFTASVYSDCVQGTMLRYVCMCM